MLWEIALLHENCALFNGSTDADSNGMFSMSKILSETLSEAVNERKLKPNDFIERLQKRIDENEEVSEEEEDGESEKEVDIRLLSGNNAALGLG